MHCFLANKTYESFIKMGSFFAGDVGSVYFGPSHPMKPHRL
ncbi:hypothetical protein BDE02_11G136500 [Populus trichocarpa]|nr:hypothetical protein BDE02_11G136500 [Populus trichocarpa]